jgi:pSer/pThr/pTyr-binding forkhead associated (FHA) protein
MSFVLSPFGNGADYLKVIRLCRESNSQDTVVLGRNEVTGLSSQECPNFQFISRQHIELHTRSARIWMKNRATQEGVVTVNDRIVGRDEIELHVGDTICFLGSLQYYNYILSADGKPPTSQPVVIDLMSTSEIPPPARSLNKTQSIGNEGNLTAEDSVELVQAVSPSPAPAKVASQDVSSAVPPATPPAAPPAPATATAVMSPGTITKNTENIMKTVVKKLLREYECSVCYETLACAVSLNPCGCCFCYACIADWVEGSNKKAKPSLNSSSSSSSTGSLSDLQYNAPCPHCNQEFSLLNVLPNRVLDAAIRGVLENVPEDLKEWEERVLAGTEMRKELQANTPTAPAAPAASVPAPAPVPGSVTAQPGRLSAWMAPPVPAPPAHARLHMRPGMSLSTYPSSTAAASSAASARTPAHGGRSSAHEIFEVDDSQPMGMGYPYNSPPRKRAAGPPSRSAAASKRANTSSVRFGDVFDLTSQAPLEPAPYAAPYAAPPLAVPSSSSSAASSGARAPQQASAGSAATRPPHYYCAMPVAIVRGMGATASQCPHCLASLVGTKVAVGTLPGTDASPTAAHYAIWGGVAGQAHWLTVCRNWYHPTCVKRVPAHAGLTAPSIQLTGVLKQDERAVIASSFGPL